MIVLDASILIAHLRTSDAHSRRAREVLDELAGRPMGASVLTLAEVLVTPASAGRVEDALHAVDLLGIASLPIPAQASRALAMLRAETRLRLPDCAVLLALEDAAEPDGVATFDDRLARAASSRGHMVYR